MVLCKLEYSVFDNVSKGVVLKPEWATIRMYTLGFKKEESKPWRACTVQLLWQRWPRRNIVGIKWEFVKLRIKAEAV